ncbi:hypothetical protein [Peribacillus asahii]|uniref:hypothetical protein n=1 Tax=Peribacillus asahii TaxID=228899 RepID=UPI00207A234D|nr:hypothetical protein [Peribacillus asahii]USK71154.1 hypothetical protein LIS76_05160 [Peribacillus asahii]
MKLEILFQKAAQYKLNNELIAEKESGRQLFINRSPLHPLSNLTIEEYINNRMNCNVRGMGLFNH